MVQARDENFPVALWLLGRRTRRQLLAIYGFARLVDDIGDEAPGDRLRCSTGSIELDELAGCPRAPGDARTRGDDARLPRYPREPFLRLIEANRRDQVRNAYETFDELLGYCRLSAAPVGELVLHVFGVATPDGSRSRTRSAPRFRSSSTSRTWTRTRARGRIYIGSVRWRRARPRACSTEGTRRCVGLLRGRARLAVAGFLAGGGVALDALEGRGRRVRAAFLRFEAVIG